MAMEKKNRCGHYDVPLILIPGDQTACAEAAKLLGPIETLVVMQASGRRAAECLPADVTQRKIYEAARRARDRLEAGQAPQPQSVPAPVRVTIELARSDMADRAAIVPGACGLEGKRVELVTDDVPSAYHAFRVAVG